MRRDPERQRRRRPDGWWYPWIFVAGMLVVIAVNGVLVAYAVDSFPGLDTENAYRKGLNYNRTIAAAQEQAERGWQMQFDVTPGAVDGEAREASLRVRLQDRGGVPLSRLEVGAILTRPAQGGFDQTVALAPLGEGTYAATVRLPMPGGWQVRIVARRDGESFQESRRLFLP